MRGMMKHAFLAKAALSHGAAYAAGSNHVTFDIANTIIGRAESQTVKMMAEMRGRGPNGERVFVPSRKWVDRSRYQPHQNQHECARRRAQREAHA